MMFDTLFLDRDGVLNKKIHNGYVLAISDVEVLPGMREFLLWARGFFKNIVVVTNQRCVGRGLLTHKELSDINEYVNSQLDYSITSFIVCPHLVDEDCVCRKPKQGLFLIAARQYKVDFPKSWMIGDSESDLIPAKELGVRTIFINESTSMYADITLSSTEEVLETFLKIIAGTIPVNTTTR